MNPIAEIKQHKYSVIIRIDQKLESEMEGYYCSRTHHYYEIIVKCAKTNEICYQYGGFLSPEAAFAQYESWLRYFG